MMRDADNDRADDLDISQKLASILYLRVQVTGVITEPSGIATRTGQFSARNSVDVLKVIRASVGKMEIGI